MQKIYDEALQVKSDYVNIVNQMLENAMPGSTLYILENEIGLHKLLHHPASEFKTGIDDVTVKVFTWKKGERIEDIIDELSGMGAEVLFLAKYIPTHYTMFDNPNKNEKLLWVERCHEDGSNTAEDATYTRKPKTDIWNELLRYFSELEKEFKIPAS